MRRVFWPALALIIVGNFAGYAVAGPNGLLAWGGYHRDLQERKVELAQLEAEKRRSFGIVRRCSIRARPIRTWPTSWCAATSAWFGPTRSSSRSTSAR